MTLAGGREARVPSLVILRNVTLDIELPFR